MAVAPPMTTPVINNIMVEKFNKAESGPTDTYKSVAFAIVAMVIHPK